MEPIAIVREGVRHFWNLRFGGLLAALKGSATLTQVGLHAPFCDVARFQDDWMRTHVHEYLTPGAQKHKASYTLTATQGPKNRYTLGGHWADTRYRFFLTIDDRATAICGFDLPRTTMRREETGVVIKQLQSLPRKRPGTSEFFTLDRHTYGRLCAIAWEDILVDALGAWSVDAGFRQLYILPASRNAYISYPYSARSREKNERLIARYDGTAQRRGFTISPNADELWAHSLPLPPRERAGAGSTGDLVNKLILDA